MFAAFLTTFFFSVSVVCGHRSARLIGGTEANFWRLTCATTILGIWAYGWGIGLRGAAFPLFLLSGILGIGVGDVALFQALPRLGSRLSLLLIQCLTAPFGALIEWCWLGTTLTALQVGCGLTVLLGVAVALSPGEHLKLTRRELVLGTIASLLAAVGGAGGAVLSRKAYSVAHAAGESINGANAAFQRIVGGLLIGGICLLLVKRREFRIQSRASRELVLEVSRKKWRGVWPWVLMNSLAGQTLGVSCMQWALETTPTGLVLAVIATTPIIVIPFAYVLEGEKPTTRSLAGGALAVAGVVALTLSRH
ncbi:MAG TPA: DMT family transporter [Candidatus Dormibacteraeota bacterium]|nr:DMT family transporter [Candidatus Dormibacteraeota bacterium]